MSLVFSQDFGRFEERCSEKYSENWHEFWIENEEFFDFDQDPENRVKCHDKSTRIFWIFEGEKNLGELLYFIRARARSRG